MKPSLAGVPSFLLSVSLPSDTPRALFSFSLSLSLSLSLSAPSVEIQRKAEEIRASTWWRS